MLTAELFFTAECSIYIMGWMKSRMESIGSDEYEKLSYSLLRDHRVFPLSAQSERVPTKD